MNPLQETNPQQFENQPQSSPDSSSQELTPAQLGAEQQESTQNPTQNEKKLRTTSNNSAQPLNLPAVDVSTVQSATQTTSDGTGASASPLIADDVDVIEKEWVDRAKAVIKAYENDPQLQEKEINKLQQNYLEKRYNKKVTKLDG
ncbi:TPA: hypothetical protein EYO12_04645 [Candidatus Saccharibacteria bacterium]|nr:hypothetical protein [Candidatus Saccharibacteria bacterium]HIO87680.1 hypothetical protein [Candidatus Saccharibacteria bacterium]